MMKPPKNPSRFVQTVFLSGVATLLAGCPTMQGPSNGTQVVPTPARPTAVPLAQTSIPAKNTPSAPVTPKQQAAATSPSPEKVIAPTASAAQGGIATVSYQELFKLHDNGDPRKAHGKTVQVAVSGQGEIGYFAKRSDAITFICKSGDRTLTANKAYKGRMQGVISDSQGWEGATVYSLRACQIVK